MALVREETIATITTPANGAIFSADRRWRYVLWRRWSTITPPLMVIGLNPSTADEAKDDPTVRRCLGYAKDWGYGALRMTNAFAWRSTDPELMFREFITMKPSVLAAGLAENDHWLQKEAAETVRQGGAILAAWGNHARWGGRNLALRDVLDGFPLACLGVTNAHEPKHPLYLRRDAKPVVFTGDGGRLCGDPWPKPAMSQEEWRAQHEPQWVLPSELQEPPTREQYPHLWSTF